MRDRLIHHHFDIDLDILWATVTQELPARRWRFSAVSSR